MNFQDSNLVQLHGGFQWRPFVWTWYGLPGSKETCQRVKGSSKAKSSCRCQPTFHPRQSLYCTFTWAHEQTTDLLTEHSRPQLSEFWSHGVGSVPMQQYFWLCPSVICREPQRSESHLMPRVGWSLENQKSLWSPYPRIKWTTTNGTWIQLWLHPLKSTKSPQSLRNNQNYELSPPPQSSSSSRCLSFLHLPGSLHQVLMYYLWQLQSSEKPAVFNRKWHGRARREWWNFLLLWQLGRHKVAFPLVPPPTSKDWNSKPFMLHWNLTMRLENGSRLLGKNMQ